MSGRIFDNVSERTFLVTGASGFIGKEVVKYILSEGAKVVAADMRIAEQLRQITDPKL